MGLFLFQWNVLLYQEIENALNFNYLLFNSDIILYPPPFSDTF